LRVFRGGLTRKLVRAPFARWKRLRGTQGSFANAKQPAKFRSELLRRGKLKASPTGEKMGKAFFIKILSI
jgi:hypothetical protein